MNQPEKNAEALEEYVRSALEQWQYTLPLLRDKIQQSNGTKIIYSVDTDIVKLFTNPVAAPGRDYGYLQMFPDDNHAECVARGRIVANHIFRNLQRNGPLLIVPPLTEELVKLHDAVARNASDEQFKAQTELRELRNEFERVRRAGDHADFLRIIQQKAPRLVRLIEGDDDATAELRRFSILFRDQLVASPDFFYAKKVFDEPILTALTSPEHSLSSALDLRDFRVKWADAIQKPTRLRAAAIDASALARIQLINASLPPKTKLVHITGDSHILRAGLEIFDSNGFSFTDQFLRHPRAFLAEPGILSIAAVSESSAEPQLPKASNNLSEFSEWLIVFLAKFWRRDHREISDLIRLAGSSEKLGHETLAIEEFCRDFPDVVADFRGRWGEFSRNLTLGHTKKLVESMPYLRNMSSFLRSSFEEIADEVSKYVDDSWRNSFQVATATSYGITRISTDQGSMTPRGRSIPVVLFDSFKTAASAITQIVQAESFIDLGDKRFARLFHNIEREDGSGYLYYLVYATLFSAEGRWPLARILAERSFGCRFRSRNQLISGREAAYFCGVAIRNSARTVNELEAAEQWIKAAEDCAKVDKARRQGLDVHELRFVLERASIRVAKKLFDVFRSLLDSNEQAEASADLAAIQREFMLLRGRAQRATASATNDREVWISRTLERRILVNILMIALIRQFYLSAELTAVEDQDVRQTYSLLAQEIDRIAAPSIAQNYLYNVIWLVSTIWLTGYSDEVANRAREELSLEKIEKYKVMPYDRQRLELFRDLIDKLRFSR